VIRCGVRSSKGTTMASFTLTATAAHSRQPDPPNQTNLEQNTSEVMSTINTPNGGSRSDPLTPLPEEICWTAAVTMTTTYDGSGSNSAPLCTLADSALPRESEDQRAKRLAAAQARLHRRQAMRNKQKSKSVAATEMHHVSSTTTTTTSKTWLEPSTLTYTAPLPVAIQRVRILLI
jgi:hypothetical protein